MSWDDLFADVFKQADVVLSLSDCQESAQSRSPAEETQ